MERTLAAEIILDGFTGYSNSTFSVCCRVCLGLESPQDPLSAEKCLKHTAFPYYLSNGSCQHSDPCSISGLIQTHVEVGSNFFPFHWVCHLLLTPHWGRGPCVLSCRVEWSCSPLCGLPLLVPKRLQPGTRRKSWRLYRLSSASDSEKAWEEQGKNRDFSWINDWFRVSLGRMCQESSELQAPLIYAQYTSWVWRRKELTVLIEIKEQ